MNTPRDVTAGAFIIGASAWDMGVKRLVSNNKADDGCKLMRRTCPVQPLEDVVEGERESAEPREIDFINHSPDWQPYY